MYLHLSKGKTPCWYDLSWNRKRCSIILKIHKDFVNSLDWIGSESPIVKDFIEDFGFDFFEEDFNKDFGFDNAFKFKKKDKNFLYYQIEIPPPFITPCEACSMQMGFDFLEPDEFPCLECRGRKQLINTNWKTAYAISATFTIFLFLPYNPIENPVSMTYLQPLTIQTCTIKDMHGGSLSGEYLYPIGEWLSSHEPNFEIISMKNAMISAHEKIFHDKQNDISKRCNFGAHVAYKNGWLNTKCQEMLVVYIPTEKSRIIKSDISLAVTMLILLSNN